MEEEGDEVGLEEGKVWLPADILDEAYQSKGYLQSQHHHHRPKSSLTAEQGPQYQHSLSKSGSKLRQRSKVLTSQASVEPGMQAVFLDSGQRSSGTGVFLPRKAESNFQPSKKPVWSPVLLPSRVVQALNLNVHALGTQLTPRQSPNNNRRGSRGDSISNKSNSNVTSQASHSSPDIFLPKEWSY